MATPRTLPLRIGCASGFWGDSEAGAAQLVDRGAIDYLVFDFLAEITMSLLARARAKSPDAGYVPDFVRIVGDLAPRLKAQGIRVVANAGGVNPKACGAALAERLASLGIPLRVAVVDGDDLVPQLDALRAQGVREMFTGDAMPPRLMSVNAYLGAQPIAAALAAGADVVVTGRVVDSAVVLGPLVHEFGWSWTDWDKLATGSLAGHVIECGTQCTGGLFTDWRTVPGWDDMGFPIAECDADGRSFVITKPPGTGGLVTPATVAEQVLYEIDDPAGYLLPDVACDFTGVAIAQAGIDRVRVDGARGRPAPDTLKVCATWSDGWRLVGTLMIGGHEAAAKARRVGESILRRCERLMAERDWPGFTETSLEALGSEATYGAHGRTAHTREVVLKIAAKHPQREALELLAREIAPSATSMAQGITGFAAGRPSPSPVVRLFSFQVPQAQVAPRVEVDGRDIGFERTRVESADANAAAARAASGPTPTSPTIAGVGTASGSDARIASMPSAMPAADTVRVPLLRLAHGRSGDKGDMSNVGIIARSDDAYAALMAVLTTDAVREHFAHVVRGEVRRYLLPGLRAFNFTMTGALGGGGVASLRYDPQGKAFAQMLLDLEVDVPAAVLETLP